MTLYAHFFSASFVLSSLICSGDEPLHRRIDRIVEAKFEGDPAPDSSDAEFFRRVHLDLAGRIPSADQTRQFLSDQSSHKRKLVIDKLLASPMFAERMADMFHVMLMERRGENPDWHSFLQNSFAKNKPWDQIVREILRPKRDDPLLRGAAFFYTKRLEKVGQQVIDYPGLTRDVGRMFLGVDLQCAQCHDHLFIDDYTQREFQGLFAVFKNVSIRNDKFPAINEKSMTEKLDFISVFEDTKQNTGPRIPFGREFQIPDLKTAPGELKKKKAPNAPPEFSALQLIADNLPSPDNQLFQKNIANRLWFCMMGRGLVEPLDQFHSSNPASHPELIRLLAKEFAAHNFDIKWMIREITLSQTWQRSSRVSSGRSLPSDGKYQIAHQRRLTADQLFWSTLQATGNLERLAPSNGAASSKEFTELKSGFLAAFGSEPKEPPTEFAPTVKRSLFLLNDAKVLELLKPENGNLMSRLLKLPNEKVASELYFSIFCRPPVEAESKLVAELLDQHKNNREAALRQLAWAMLSSMEFAVNH